MKLSLRMLSGVVVVLISQTAFAEKPRFGDTLSFSFGGMDHRGNMKIAVTRDDAPVDKLDFTDLGMSDETDVFWGDLTWQFAERWKFRLNYSSFDSKGEKTATADGNYDDLDWTIGARLTSDFDMKIFIADLTWDFLKSEKGHLGVGGGLHAIDIDFDLLLEVGAQVGDEGGTVDVRGESDQFLVPLPNVSLAGGYMLGESVYVSASLGYLSFNIDKYDGHLFSARASAEWRPWRNVGFGAAYQYLDADVEIDQSDRTEFYAVEFYGPILFVSVGF